MIEFLKEYTKLEIVDRGLWFYAVYKATRGKKINIINKITLRVIATMHLIDIIIILLKCKGGFMVKKLCLFVMCLMLASILISCSSNNSVDMQTSNGQTDVSGNTRSKAMEIADAFIGGFRNFYVLGNRYKEEGMQLQAEYAYSWAAASVTSMRILSDYLLSAENANEETNKTEENTTDWDEIASMNYASPYPWFFKGMVRQAQDKVEEAAACYENALINPAFDGENARALFVLGTMTVDEIKELQKKLSDIEKEIYSVYKPEPASIPADPMNFSDNYLCIKAREALEANAQDYKGAFRYFEAALKVNPFEGDNYTGCALMCLYLDNIDRAYFYVNEGLYADPQHAGLNKIADTMNGGV